MSMPALLLTLVASFPVAGDYFIASPGPHEASRGEDGTTKLTLTVTNLSGRDLRLALRPSDDSCSAGRGSSTLAAYLTAEVSFTMNCQPGTDARTVSLRARPVDSTGRPILPTSIPLEFTVSPADEPEWSPMWAFLFWGVPLSLLGV